MNEKVQEAVFADARTFASHRVLVSRRRIQRIVSRSLCLILLLALMGNDARWAYKLKKSERRQLGVVFAPTAIF